MLTLGSFTSDIIAFTHIHFGIKTAIIALLGTITQYMTAELHGNGLTISQQAFYQ